MKVRSDRPLYLTESPFPLITQSQIRHLLEQVKDPEIPVLSLVDLGVVRDIRITDEQVEVVITLTYTGCPAMRVMEEDIIAQLHGSGIENVKVTTVLSPAWSTDDITEKGLKSLADYGIAPPPRSADKRALLGKESKVRCPLCHSTDTEMVSQFGSTPCKSLYRCRECREPFDHFKCI